MNGVVVFEVGYSFFQQFIAGNIFKCIPFPINAAVKDRLTIIAGWLSGGFS